MKINQVFLDKMKDILGDELEEFVAAMDKPIQKSVYVNENKISVENFKKIIDFNIEEIPYEKAGFYVDNEKKGRHQLHHAGAFYMQEPSAMFTVNSIKFNGDEKVLDMCAAPGGKTIQIANRIPNGVLVSNEFVKSRSEILFSNVERMGLKNVVITNESPENISKAYGDCFDVVFVDAPCSGEGMFRRGEDVVDQWHIGINKMCQNRQIEILNFADRTLKQGGTLVYSTCTYAVEENEDVVNWLLENKGYELINIDGDFSRGFDMTEVVRLYPHKVKGEGQFIAVLRKTQENNFSCETNLKLTNSSVAKQFIKENLKTEFDVVEYKNNVYFTPNKDVIKKRINYVSVGVRLGEVVQNRFEPHHNIFTAFGNDFDKKICLNYQDKNVEKYLRGETLDLDLTDGYGAIIVDGCALGGFKISKGKFKNFYPKGLRNF